MNILEKFYSDSLKLVQKQEFNTNKDALCSFFCRTIRTYDKQLLPIAEDIAQHWMETHRNDAADNAAQWFYAVFSLLDNSFTNDMDFSDADWNALQAIVTAYSDSLSIEFLQSFMGIVLERHKID